MTQGPDGLQFDRAEYAEGAKSQPRCAACGAALWSSYYAVNGKTACEKCKTDLELSRDQGSGVGRFLRASVYGFGAALVGAGIWYGIRAATGLEIGFIAIIVGLMVGGAVRKGSSGRGGWRYQALAMLLTYGSIVSTYVPMIFDQLRQDSSQKQTAMKDPAAPGATPASSATPDAAAKAPAAPAVASGPEGQEPPSLGRALVGVVIVAAIVVAIAFAAPFLMGFQNVIGVFIIAIGLYEAWKMNRRVPLEITGPHSVGSLVPTPPSPDGG